MRISNSLGLVEKHAVERIIEEKAPVIDLQPIHEKHQEFDLKLMTIIQAHNQLANGVIGELEMQRRALVSLKAQRDIDRKRKLQLLKRLKKHHDKQKQVNFRYKLAIGASILFSILTLIIK
jgi:hypothetical protein